MADSFQGDIDTRFVDVEQARTAIRGALHNCVNAVSLPAFSRLEDVQEMLHHIFDVAESLPVVDEKICLTYDKWLARKRDFSNLAPPSYVGKWEVLDWTHWDYGGSEKVQAWLVGLAAQSGPAPTPKAKKTKARKKV